MKTVLILSALFCFPMDCPAQVVWDAKKAPEAPEFDANTVWLDSTARKLADQKKNVVLIHFWTHGCINCIHNYPHYNSLQDKFKENKNFQMIGIHTPEFESEKKPDNIRAAIKKNKLTFAVAVDNESKNWKNWGNQYWPCVYLLDKGGKVRFRWDGELGDKGLKKVTETIEELLKE